MSLSQIFRPEFAGSLSAGLTSLQQGAAKVFTIQNSPWIFLAIIFIISIGVLIWYFGFRNNYETPSNIRNRTMEAVQAQSDYSMVATNRKGLRLYLEDLKVKGIPGNQIPITNFYVSTVNATGLFFPASGGVISDEAARLAVLAGARAFVFDIWPDMTPGTDFAPILQTVAEGSFWRRISMNARPFQTVLAALIQEAFEIPERPGAGDPVFLYLRFRGKPKRGTFTGTAKALRTIIERYRLEPPYYKGAQQSALYSQQISQFFNKIIVFSNMNARGTALEEYINVGPQDGYKMEWEPRDAKGLTEDRKVAEISRIKQNLTWVAPPSESTLAEKNFDFTDSHKLGIQFVAMNFWNKNDDLKNYMKVFEKTSFVLKPEGLRYTIETLPAPAQPANPGYGRGEIAGTLPSHNPFG